MLMVVDCGGSDQGSIVVAPGLAVIEDESSVLPANGGCTDESVGVGCCGSNIDVVPVSSMPLDPFGIMDFSTSVIPVYVPKFLSCASPSTWSSVWLLSLQCPMVTVFHILVPLLGLFFNDILP
jgi:hypothetical protein